MDNADSAAMPTGRLRHGQLVAIDAAVAVGYSAILVTFVLTQRHDAVHDAVSGGVPIWAQCLIVVAVGLPIAVRRLWPLPVFGVVLALSLLTVFLNMVRDPFLATAFTLYLLARRAWAPRIAIGVLGLAALFGVRTSATPFWWMNGVGLLLFGSAAMGGAWLLGRAVQQQRDATTLAARRLAEHAVVAERLHIARELHDIVTHSMGVIAVKAGVANHVIGARPEEAHEALRAIEATSRTALAEMRQLLGVLRAAPDPDDVDPGLPELATLAAGAAMAGVQVELDVRGADELPSSMGRTIYRIVQEAVTNVIKHAAPAHCRVAVTVDRDGTRIEITDDGPGTRMLPAEPGAGGGQGLLGIRERAALHGGTATAGPRPSGGFGVSVHLPRPTA